MRKNFAKGVGVGAGLVLIGMMLGAQADRTQIVGFAATDNYLYRLHEDGNIDFIAVRNERTGKGVADWTELTIDTGRKAREQPH